MQYMEVKVRNGEDGDEEDLVFYPIKEEKEQTVAIVSIGHIDYRAKFIFGTNQDAIDCFNALKKIKEMDIQ